MHDGQSEIPDRIAVLGTRFHCPSAEEVIMKKVAVSVQNDYLERMSKTRPINAVAELVWNSLDADADRVKVKLVENDMGGLERLTVTDNGNGLEYSLAEHAFGSLRQAKNYWPH
jgi:C4-dicarboxylate-specific signal transduction histidine kinase